MTHPPAGPETPPPPPGPKLRTEPTPDPGMPRPGPTTPPQIAALVGPAAP